MKCINKNIWGRTRGSSEITDLFLKNMNNRLSIDKKEFDTLRYNNVSAITDSIYITNIKWQLCLNNS